MFDFGESNGDGFRNSATSLENINELLPKKISHKLASFQGLCTGATCIDLTWGALLTMLLKEQPVLLGVEGTRRGSRLMN